MDQADAELLERIVGGDRVIRPGPGESGRMIFEALVAHLRDLRARGFIDMPERSVAQAADQETGAFLMAGPCYLTGAGREALETFRRGDRRQTDRRQVYDPSAIPPSGDRRRGDRRGPGHS